MFWLGLVIGMGSGTNLDYITIVATRMALEAVWPDGRVGAIDAATKDTDHD